MFVWGKKGGKNTDQYYDIIIFNLKKGSKNNILTVVMNNDGDERVHKTGLSI